MSTLARNKLPSALVVDDDELYRDVLCGMLRALGLESIQIASNGRVAMQVLASMNPTPDFVICDVFMPELDGIELLNQLAALQYAGGIVILSGGDVQMLRISMQIACANGLAVLGALTKPVGSEQMAKVLGLQPMAQTASEA